LPNQFFATTGPMAIRIATDVRVVLDETPEDAPAIGGVTCRIEDVLMPEEVQCIRPRRDHNGRALRDEDEKVPILRFECCGGGRVPPVTPGSLLPHGIEIEPHYRSPQGSHVGTNASAEPGAKRECSDRDRDEHL
jgi:hypothetical protein